jgi:L-alanine-DL-glutamate epimerase-like enolase superfamily enzyme
MIRSLAVRPYRVEWVEPTGDARRRFRERSGLLLELEDADGRVGHGEAAPLEGRSGASLSESREALESLTPGLLDGDFRSAARLLPPSLVAARHALESALLELEALRLGVPTHHVLARALGRAPSPVSLEACALVDPQELVAAVERAQRSFELGFRTLKLKIGGEPAEQIVARVRAVAAACPGARLRLDANRTLTQDDARALSLALRHSIEFLEDPCEKEPESPLEVPLALDEPLADPAFDPSSTQAEILVLKPMLLGVDRCLEIASSTRAKLVVSHSFDGPHAMATARALALALGPGRPADGLGGHAVLSSWPEPLPERLLGPVIEPWAAPGAGFPPRS